MTVTGLTTIIEATVYDGHDCRPSCCANGTHPLVTTMTARPVVAGAMMVTTADLQASRTIRCI
eukprot:5384762-Prymnesium_polylepis.1